MGGLPLKPKLQGYVQQELFDEFERFRATHNLNQSKALEKLLAEYFGKPSASTLPPVDALATSTLADSLRAELAALRLELVQRLEVVESRLAIESATIVNELAAPLDGLAEVSADNIPDLINVPIASDATTTPTEQIVSAANLKIESAVVEDVNAVPVTVSAISSADGLATNLAELVASSADESASESVEEEVASELAADEPEEEAAGVEKEIAVPKELITATDLAPILGVTQPTVGRAAKNLGHEKFRKWSSKQKGSAGRTWDFILVQKGGKEVPQFFQVTDTPSE